MHWPEQYLNRNSTTAWNPPIVFVLSARHVYIRHKQWMPQYAEWHTLLVRSRRRLTRPTFKPTPFDFGKRGLNGIIEQQADSVQPAMTTKLLLLIPVVRIVCLRNNLSIRCHSLQSFCSRWPMPPPTMLCHSTAGYIWKHSAWY